jgi:hypothetical protein
MPVYSRDDWNSIISQINDLAAQCPDIIPLDLVPENTIWRVSHVEDVQNKLVEVCEDNIFTPPTKWLQSMIDEITAAIANGSCCCEETDRSLTGAVDFVVDGGLLLLFRQSSSPFEYRKTFAWAQGITEETEAPGTQSIPLATGGTLDLDTGGPRWVGRKYRSWECYIYPDGEAMPVTPVTSGTIVDGFIWIGTDESKTRAILLDAAIRDERDAFIAYHVALAGGNPATIAAALQALNDAQSALTAAQASSDEHPRWEAYPYSVDHVSGSNWLVTASGPDGFSSEMTAEAITPNNTFIFDLASVPDAPYGLDIELGVGISGDGVVVLRLLCT